MYFKSKIKFGIAIFTIDLKVGNEYKFINEVSFK
jgi:hypothetical protein